MTPAEFERHRLTHLPYHPGCPCCRMGRRPNAHLRRRRSKPRTIPHVVADYGFLRSTDDDLITTLVVYIRPWRIYWATVCDVKGPSANVVKRLAQLYRDTGLTHFTYKSDREASVRSLLLEAAKLASVKADPDEDGEDNELEDDDLESASQPQPPEPHTHTRLHNNCNNPCRRSRDFQPWRPATGQQSAPSSRSRTWRAP